MTKTFTSIVLFTILTQLFSCGPVDNAVGSLADQVQSQINGVGSFTQNDLQGIWQTEVSFYHYNLPQIFDEAQNLPQERFNKLTDESEEVMREQFLGNCTSLNAPEQNIDEVTSKFYLIIKGDTYQYVALSSVQSSNVINEKCWVEISNGKYDILGDYLHLKDLNVAFSVNFIDSTNVDIGFATN